jgi:hypothetical protein
LNPFAKNCFDSPQTFEEVGNDILRSLYAGGGTISLKAIHHFLQSKDEPFDFCRDMEAPRDIFCGLALHEANLESVLCHQFWKHIFVFAGDTVTFFKKTKPGRV